MSRAVSSNPARWLLICILPSLAIALATTARAAATEPTPARPEARAEAEARPPFEARLTHFPSGQDQGAEEADPALYTDALVHEIAFEFETEDWQQAIACNRGGPAGEDVPAAMVIDGHALPEAVGLRCKGNSSTSIRGPKKPLNLTTDAFAQGQDLWGFDVVNFNNNFADPSLLRDALALKVLSQFMPVPRYAYAKVTVNGEYLGLYTLVEQINREWADHWYPGDDGVAVRGDSPEDISFESSTLAWEGEALEPYKAGYEVKGRLADSDEGYIALREMIRALDAPPSAGGPSPEDFEAAIWEKLDVDTALWHLVGTSVVAHYDSYYVGKNYYMFLGERDPRFHMINWDLGLAFGLFGYRPPAGQDGGGRPPGGAREPAETVSPFVQEDADNRPLIQNLLAVPAFRADYIAHYRTVLERVFTAEWVEEVGQSYQDLIQDAARQEFETHGSIGGQFSYEQFLQSFRQTPAGQGGGGRPGGGFGLNAPGILPLVEARRAYLMSLPEMAAPDVVLESQSIAPEAPTAADAVQVSASFSGADARQDVELRYTVRGGIEQRIPMQGRPNGSWTATIPAQREGRAVSYVFRVGLADGRAAFFPAVNLLRPYGYEVAGVELPVEAPGALVINELMADNETTLADEAGQFEDWVELYNRGDAPIELGGYYLSDDPVDPYAFPLPSRMLAPGEHLLIWCDNDPGQGPLHAPFRLSRQGEAVALARRDAIVDAIVFEELPTDISLGRSRDGADDWALCGPPSPGAANTCDGTAAPPTPTLEPPVATPTPGGSTERSRIFLPVLRRD